MGLILRIRPWSQLSIFAGLKSVGSVVRSHAEIGASSFEYSIFQVLGSSREPGTRAVFDRREPPKRHVTIAQQLLKGAADSQVQLERI